MKRTVEAGKTLLIDGPASVTLLSGDVEILGAQFKPNLRMVIRESKRVPFLIDTNAEFEVLLGEKGGVNEIAGSSIPESWESAVSTILSDTHKPETVMIVGAIDVGKTSFCAYLANRALKEKRRVAIIDADLGQSDLGPPSAVSSRRIVKPIRDLFEIGARNVCFIGVTSPSSAVSEVIDGIAKMKEKFLKAGIDLLIVNTDGWIESEDAVRYKLALVKRIKPPIVIGIQEQNELTFLLGTLRETQNIAIEPSSAIRKRDREERRFLRELGYRKYLKGATTQLFPLNWVKITGVPFGPGASPSRSHMDKIVEHIGSIPLYCEETPSLVFIVLSKEQWADEEIANALEEALNKKVKIVWEGDEEGLLVGLHDEDSNFLGIGIIEQLDYNRRALKVCTNVKKSITSIHVGRVKLDKSGRELEQSNIFSD